MDRSFTKYAQERFCFLRRADSLFATGEAERDKGWHRQAGRRFEFAAELYRRTLLSLMARKSLLAAEQCFQSSKDSRLASLCKLRSDAILVLWEGDES